MSLLGTLKGFGVTEIFQLISQQMKTGTLILTSPESTISLAFDNGIIQGIKNGVGALVDAVKAAAQAALDAAKGFLGIESPSKAFALEVADPSIEGWAGALERGVARIRAASGRLAEASVEGAGKAIWAPRPSGGPAGLGGLVINIYFNADSVRSERDIYRMAEEIERSLTLRVLPRLVT